MHGPVASVRKIGAYVFLLCCLIYLVQANPSIAGPIPLADVQTGVPPKDVVPVAIFGTDDRREVPDNLSPLEGKIGMLYEQATQTLCTAFCVGKDLIATAAHCLFQPKNNRLPDLEDVTFRLTYGNTLQTSGIFARRTLFTKNYIAVGTTSFSNEPPLSAAKDWAVVKLERPACRFGFLKVDSRPVLDLVKKSEENKIFQIAYHWDFLPHWKLAYSTPCRIQRDYDQIKWQFIRQHFLDHEQLILHNCDTGGASSGSPLLLMPEIPGAPIVVGINVGTYTRTRLLMRDGEVAKKLDPDVIANTGVNGTAFSNVIEQMGSAEIINSKEDMVRMQTELQIRGFYAGALDGTLGRETRAAIIDFETSNASQPTGLPTQALLRRFGAEQVTPTRIYSNGKGVVTTEHTEATSEPKPPFAPKRRPRRPVKPPPFDPFHH